MNEMKKADIILRTIGAISVAMALIGLWYNLSGLPHILMNRHHDPSTPYFLPAFSVMSLVCIACFVLLLLYGITFLRTQIQHYSAFKTLMIFEVIYFLSIGMILWPMPKIGMSVAAATGVANGGLSLQLITLFPLWATLILRWVVRKKQDSSNQRFQAIGNPGSPQPEA